MSLMNPRAQGFQSLRDRIAHQVRPGDGVTEIDHHFGNPAHAASANPDKVNVFNLVFHVDLSGFQCF
jgi:hypothetical protein